MRLRGGERAASASQTMARKPGPWPPSPHFHSSWARQGSGGMEGQGAAAPFPPSLPGFQELPGKRS